MYILHLAPEMASFTINSQSNTNQIKTTESTKAAMLPRLLSDENSQSAS